MCSLTFYHGVMTSGKTAMLLMKAGSYIKGEKILLLKPSIDTRDVTIKSRTGMFRQADYIVNPIDNIYSLFSECGYVHILIDEVQFLSIDQIDQLRKLASITEVSCFGLKTTYLGTMFDASKRLFELSDKIREIKTSCSVCSNKKATMNFKILHGSDTCSDIIDIGGDDKYKPLCWPCYTILSCK